MIIKIILILLIITIIVSKIYTSKKIKEIRKNGSQENKHNEVYDINLKQQKKVTKNFLVYYQRLL